MRPSSSAKIPNEPSRAKVGSGFISRKRGRPAASSRKSARAKSRQASAVEGAQRVRVQLGLERRRQRARQLVREAAAAGMALERVQADAASRLERALEHGSARGGALPISVTVYSAPGRNGSISAGCP